MRRTYSLVQICIALLIGAGCVEGGALLDGEPIFSDEDVKQCGDIRIPEMTVTPSGVLLLAQCRYANVSVASQGHRRRLDDMSHAKVLTKFSADMGKTWGRTVVLTPEPGHSHPQAVYDRVRKQVLLQYQYHPSVDPEFNSTLYQRVSTDDGRTWGPERVITDLLAGCNPRAPQDMQVGTAGAKIQTSSGRILFVGHASGTGCRWYTDDGGQTFTTSSPYKANEAAVAESSPGNIFMSGRNGGFSWHPNRTQWFSHDDGATFSAAEPSQLLEDAKAGCSAGLGADPFPAKVSHRGGAQHDGETDGVSRLFLSEPAGPGRIGLTVHCSKDGGVTWPHSKAVGGANDPAAYSAIRVVEVAPGKHRLLLVWETKPNFRWKHLKTDWCS